MSEAIVSAVEAAWAEGCPVASNAEATAKFSHRRMMSFERRAKKSLGRLARIDDLGEGLAQDSGDPTSWASPLKEDYRFLAERIVDAADLAPWARAKALHPVRSTLTGLVSSIQPFGVFVRLQDTEVPGLVMVPNLFPHRTSPAPKDVWPALETSIDCSVISHAEGRRQIDLAPTGFTDASGGRIVV